MATHYKVKAILAGQGTVNLDLYANNEDEARLQIAKQGGMVLSVQKDFSKLSFKSKTRFPLVQFSQELLSLLTAGLSLVESIETLVDKERDVSNKKVIRSVLTHLYDGTTFSLALENSTEFPALYIATVRASERTGDLPEALQRFITYQKQIDSVSKKLIGASIYPALLLIIGITVSFFLLVFVVPKFSAIYNDVGTDLPWLSMMLMEWGHFAHERSWEMVGMLLFVLGIMIYGATRPSVWTYIMQNLWRVPAIGERMRIYQLARFYKTLGMLLRGGIPITQALEMVSGLLQSHFRPRVIAAAKQIREGRTISSAMEAEGLTTAVGNRMLSVGEKTGLMGDMMERIGNFHDEETTRWVEWATKLIEPILMAVIGFIIGGIVILMYMPIFDLAGSIN
jgi:general secretion pathway protein F